MVVNCINYQLVVAGRKSWLRNFHTLFAISFYPNFGGRPKMSFAFFEDMNMAAIVICIKWNRHKNKSPEKSQLTPIYFAIITIAKLKTIFQTSIKIAQKHLGQRAFLPNVAGVLGPPRSLTSNIRSITARTWNLGISRYRRWGIAPHDGRCSRHRRPARPGMIGKDT